MSFRPRWLAVLFLMLSSLVTAPLAATAQDAPARVSERLRHKDRLASVDLPANTVAAVFTVAPIAAAEVRAQRMGTGRRQFDHIGQMAKDSQDLPVAPDPVSQETMDRIALTLGGGAEARGVRMPGNPAYGNVTFIARRLSVDENGNLDAASSQDVDPSAPATRFDKNSPGAMSVRLKVEQGATYMVDFSVKSEGGGTYRVETSGGTKDLVDEQGKVEHVLVVLEATKSGWVDFKLGRMGDSVHWVLEVRVNRIDMA